MLLCMEILYEIIFITIYYYYYKVTYLKQKFFFGTKCPKIKIKVY